MELETASSFFPSLQIYKGTSPVCIALIPLFSRHPVYFRNRVSSDQSQLPTAPAWEEDLDLVKLLWLLLLVHMFILQQE